MRQVILYRDEDGDWVVECPSLKGCISQGKTKEEALANIKEAISGYIAALEMDITQNRLRTRRIIHDSHFPIPDSEF